MIKKALLGILLFLIAFTGVVIWLYEKYKETLADQPPYFDLFVAEVLFEPDDEAERYTWGTGWNELPSEHRRPIEWFMHKDQFEKLDSVYLGYQNSSNEKLYYMTWGAPNSRMRMDLAIYRNGTIDSIPFGGFGCGTGVHLAPLEIGELSESIGLNPLMYNPYTGYPLPIKNKKFPELYRKIYGDSIAIKFRQGTYSLPWNRIPSQMIESPVLVVSTEKIIDNWQNGLYRLDPDFEKEYELAFFVKEESESLTNK